MTTYHGKYIKLKPNHVHNIRDETETVQKALGNEKLPETLKLLLMLCEDFL